MITATVMNLAPPTVSRFFSMFAWPRFVNDVLVEGVAIIYAESSLTILACNKGDRRTPRTGSVLNGVVVEHILHALIDDGFSTRVFSVQSAADRFRVGRKGEGGFSSSTLTKLLPRQRKKRGDILAHISKTSVCYFGLKFESANASVIKSGSSSETQSEITSAAVRGDSAPAWTCSCPFDRTVIVESRPSTEPTRSQW